MWERGRWGCEEVRGKYGRVYGMSVLGCGEGGGEVWRVWGKVRRDVGDVKKFGEMCRVNWVSVGV